MNRMQVVCQALKANLELSVPKRDYFTLFLLDHLITTLSITYIIPKEEINVYWCALLLLALDL